MTQEHPITPPSDLIQQWWDGTHGAFYELEAVVTQAARWGADQELDACRLWVSENCDIYSAVELIQSRRPKPPSLKELALEALASADGADHPVVATVLTADQHALIRRALEQLDD